MADSVGIGASGGRAAGLIAAASPLAPVVAATAAADFAAPPPSALLSAALVQATVVGRGADGTLVLRTAYGQIALKTALLLPAGQPVDLRIMPGSPPSVQIHVRDAVAHDAAAAPAPPGAPSARLDLGTTIAATVMEAAAKGEASRLPVGTRLVLRLAASPDAAAAAAETAEPAAGVVPAGSSAIIGRVIAGKDGALLLTTPLGLLALDRRLALPSGATVSFERLGTTLPPDGAADAPLAQRSGWPALDEALAALDRAAPDLAARLRADLAPASAASLAGTLLFLAGALKSGAFPGNEIEDVLLAAGHDKLRDRLVDDAAEFRRLDGDPATGDWRVLVLPLLEGGLVQPVRLYLRRRGQATSDGAPDGARFILEVEMSRLGALQLDGFLRAKRFDMVLRSRRALDAALRQDLATRFRAAIAADGLAGDITFATASRFAVAPLDGLRRHVAFDA